MKLTNNIFATIICLLIFSACHENDLEIVSEDRMVEMTFGLELPNSSTRAQMKPNDKEKFMWVNGDQVSIFAQGHDNVPGNTFTFSEYAAEDYKHQGFFSGKTWDITDDKYFWALYPAQSDARLVGNTINAVVECTIPTQQKAYNNTFDPAACIQVGTASKATSSIQLENVCAFFYITVGKGCKGIKISAVDNEEWNMSGKVQVKASSSGASIQQFTGNNQNYVELTDIPSEGGTFYLAFVPSTHNTPSLEVSLTGTWAASFKLSSKKQFNAGHLYNLGDYTEEYKKLTCYCTIEGCVCTPNEPCGHDGCYCMRCSCCEAGCECSLNNPCEHDDCDKCHDNSSASR